MAWNPRYRPGGLLGGRGRTLFEGRPLHDVGNGRILHDFEDRLTHARKYAHMIAEDRRRELDAIASEARREMREAFAKAFFADYTVDAHINRLRTEIATMERQIGLPGSVHAYTGFLLRTIEDRKRQLRELRGR